MAGNPLPLGLGCKVVIRRRPQPGLHGIKDASIHGLLPQSRIPVPIATRHRDGGLCDTVSEMVVGVTCEQFSEEQGECGGFIDRRAIDSNFRRRQEVCDAQLEQFLAVLRPLLVSNRATAAWIIGSRARGSAAPESDIDVMIVERTDRTFVDRFRDYMPALLETSVAVDMLVYTPEEFERMQAEERPFIVEALRGALPIHVER